MEDLQEEKIIEDEEENLEDDEEKEHYKEDTIAPWQIAEVLGICQKYVYKLIKSPNFPSIPNGKHFIIPKGAFFNWINNPEHLIEFKKRCFDGK